MSESYASVADKVVSGMALLREAAPDLGKAFGALAAAGTRRRAARLRRIRRRDAVIAGR